MISTLLAQAPDFNDLENALGDDYKSKFGGANRGIAAFFNLGIINIIFFAAGAAFLFLFITAGITMMTSAGNPKAIEGAKAKLTQALIGFVIIFCAYWIVQIVGLMLGIPGFGGIFRSMATSGVICTNCLCGGVFCDGACSTGNICIPR